MKAREFIPGVEMLLKRRGEPAYRLEQAYGALCSGLIRDWEEATALPKSLQAALSAEITAAVLELVRLSKATDGTRKYLFETLAT